MPFHKAIKGFCREGGGERVLLTVSARSIGKQFIFTCILGSVTVSEWFQCVQTHRCVCSVLNRAVGPTHAAVRDVSRRATHSAGGVCRPGENIIFFNICGVWLTYR